MDVPSSNCTNETNDENPYNCSNLDEATSKPSGMVTLYIFVAIQVLLVIFIIMGNSLILLAIRQGQLIRKVSYYFIANLAIADILFGLVLALRLVFLLSGTLHTETCVLILFLATVLAFSSGNGIFFLCLETYLAVRHIVVYKTAFTPKVAWILIICSWVVWSLFSLVMLYHPDADEIPPTECTFAHPFFSRIFLSLCWSAGFLLMIIIMITELLTVYHIKKHIHGMLNQQNQPGTSTEKAPQETERQKRMLARVSAMSQLVALILACYVLTWGPYTVALMLITVCPACGVTGLHLVYLTLVLSLNSAANVIIFTFKSKEFRKIFKKMLTCKKAQVEPFEHTTMS